MNWHCLFMAIGITVAAISCALAVIASSYGLFSLGQKYPKTAFGVGIGLIFSACVAVEYFSCLGYLR